MAAQWPLVVDRLLALLPTLDGWSAVNVIDGQPVADDVTDLYCTVGYVDGDDAGSYTQQMDHTGCRLQEVGEVKCQLVAQTDANDLPGTRGIAFPLADAFEAAIRADYRLAVLSPDSTSSISTSVSQQQTSVGPFVSIIFTFSYSTIT